MISQEIKILLIEDNPGDARLVREALTSVSAAGFEVEQVDRLADGIERLRRPDVDVVLLDLLLPDSAGFDTITRLNREAPRLPIVVLSGLTTAELIQDAVKRGAEDYLVKGAFSADVLVRAIRYAIDRHHAREELAQARDSALESARLRSEFLANMSHEIRTPLNGIVGMTRLLMDTRLTNDQLDMLEIACQSADTLVRIVNDVLDFSKISAGKVLLEETDFDLGKAVENVITLFGDQVQRKGVELASYIDGDVPVLLRGDPARLCQVLTNLVGNAIKFTPQGEVTTRIGMLHDRSDDVVLRFTIKDTGIGIPLEGQRHLFQAFVQGDGSTTRKFGGTGLGLAISGQLVELMGGNIGVQSEPGGGSTFWFTATFRKQPATRARNAATARLQGVRMLVVDHRATSARIVSEHAGAWGIRCDTVATAADTLAALQSAAADGSPYDVALIELQLPEMDGLTLGRIIKADPALVRTRLLGMYSLGGRPNESQMRAAGFRALLVKPVKQSQLLNSLSIAMAAAAPETPVADEPGRDAIPSRRRRVREIRSRLPVEVRARARILLVEDNIVNQQVEIRMLERIGYKADWASNGREALEKLANNTYDIILMDCQMPQMDGYTATREIRRHEGAGTHVTIIGVTAHALVGDREECLAAGMDDYISKPVIPEDLAAILEKWVMAGNVAAEVSPSRLKAPEYSDSARQAAILDLDVIARLRECQKPGEHDFLTHLIGVFLADLSDRLTALRSALTLGDTVGVREAAHALKGGAGELGARRMQSMCEQLEMTARDGFLGGAEAMLRELEREAHNLREALEAEKMRASA